MHHLSVSSAITSVSKILQKVVATVIGRDEEHSFTDLFFFGTGVRRPEENEVGTIPVVNTIRNMRSR